MHIIPLNKLKKLINPFEEINEDLPFIITKQEIKNRIKKIELFTDPNLPIEENTLRKIAYHVLNTKNPIVQIKLPDGVDSNISSIVIADNDNMYKYIAALYRNDKEISVELEASIRAANLYLKINLKEDEVLTKRSNTINMVHWNLPEDNLESWDNMDFIFKHINSDNMNEGFKKIPKNLWEDKFFIKEMMNILNSDLKEILTDDIKWSKPYIETIIENGFAQNIMHMFSHEYKLYLKGKSKCPELMEIFKLNLFDSKDALVKNKRILQNAAIEFVSDELRYNNEILDALFDDYLIKDSKINYIYNYVFWNPFARNTPLKNKPSQPLIYLKDKSIQWKDDFVVKYSDILSKIECRDLLTHWIDDETKIKDYFNKKDGIHYIKFYSSLSPEMKESKEIADIVMNLDPLCYNKLSMENKLNEDYIKKVFIKNSNYKIEIPSKLFDIIKDVELIETLFKAGFYYNFKNANISEEIKYNVRYIKVLSQDEIINNMNNPKFRDAVEQDYELTKSMAGIRRFYERLSRKLQSDEGIVLEELKWGSKVLKDGTIPEFAHYLFGSKEFCIKAMKIHHTITEYVPDNFWLEKDFVTQFFQLIDNDDIDDSAINFLPQIIRNILDKHEITEDFINFFNKYTTGTNLYHRLSVNDAPIKKMKI